MAGTFESEPEDGDNYGERYRGFLCPPYTGFYTFYVASDDASELWLSTDDKVANRKRIAYLNGSVQLRNWYKNASQKSAPIYLEAGKQYYIEGLHKEGGGGDNFAVAFTTPSGEFQAPIEGKHLSPFTTNNAPTVSLTAPAANTSYELGSNVTISANASDDGSITKVEFFVDDILVATDNSNPYQITWKTDIAGPHKLYARATDNGGRVTSSAKTTINVFSLRNPENPQFSVNGLDYEYYEGAWTKLPDFYNLFTTERGTATTIDLSKRKKEEGFGLVFKGFIEVPTDGFYEFFLDADDGVQFLVGDESVIFYDGIHGMSTPRTGGIGLKAGKHAFTINYFQGLGGKGISFAYKGPGIAQQTVPDSKLYRQTFSNARPTVSITSTITTTTAPATVVVKATAADADGTIDRVNFYMDGVLIGTKTTAPFEATKTNIAAGSHTFKAVAYDNLGDSTTSNNIVHVVSPTNVAPTVAITSPKDQDKFNEPADVLINITATDNDGTVTTIEVYNGAIKIATLTTAPYSYLWKKVPEGSYSITAKAIDDDGASTTSSIVNIKVELVTGDLFNAFEENSNVLDVYPNPILTTSKVAITLSEGGSGLLQVVDMRGQVHYSKELGVLKAGKNVVSFDASDLSSGQYLMTLQVGNNKYISKIMRGQQPEKAPKN